MNVLNNPQKKKSTAVEAIEKKLVAAFEAATDDDRAKAAALVKRATGSKRDVALVTITPGMAAVLFFDHNKQNREWKAQVSAEYAQDAIAGEWEFTNQGIGFLVTGDVGDGQHRLAGIALAGIAVEVLLAFGMERKAILTLDIGHRRQASDYLEITKQATDGKRKQQMVRRAFGFLVRDPDENQRRAYVLRPGNRDMATAIVAHDKLLKQAMDIGDESVKGRSKPTFTAAEAAAYAFLLLLKGWPAERVIDDVDVFQSGEDRDGGNSPLFVAADQLQKDATKRDKSGITARFGAAIKAFILHEQGVKAVRVTDIRAAMKPKHWVDPSFPHEELKQAAA